MKGCMRNECPQCGSVAFVKNGMTRHHAQNYLCRGCGRQFVRELQIEHISDRVKALVLRLKEEQLSLESICRICSVSRSWLVQFFKTQKSHTGT